MDRHEQFRGHYLVMNNAPIHTHEDIQKHIESRGYGCVYLPPYSLELNPIEQFWSVFKSKLKREQLLDEETL
jgi:transposase